MFELQVNDFWYWLNTQDLNFSTVNKAHSLKSTVTPQQDWKAAICTTGHTVSTYIFAPGHSECSQLLSLMKVCNVDLLENQNGETSF